MIYPSKEHSIVQVGDNTNAIFNLTWFTPGSYDPPASFDLVVSVAKEITDVLKVKREGDKNFQYEGEYDLEPFLNLTERNFGLVPDLDPLKGVVWDDLEKFGAEVNTVEIKKVFVKWKNKREKLTDLFIISGSPSKGYVSVRKGISNDNVIIIGFHYWDGYELIKVKVTFEAFLFNSYPKSPLPIEEWPREEVDKSYGTNGIGAPIPPTIFYPYLHDFLVICL
jgi:hypothetical protein